MSKKHHDPDLDDIEVDVSQTVDTLKPGLEHPNYEQLEAQLNAAEKKANENWEQVLRLQAEIENIHRRQERDLAQAHKFATESVFRSLLDVADNLERALEQKMTAENEVLRTGVELTLKQLQNVFTKNSIKAINPLHEVFDPTLHEAMSMQESAEQAPGTVLTVLQKGYQLHERLLRPAMVVVAKAVENKS